MEFVNFKDNLEPIGARVIEGFALSNLPLSYSVTNRATLGIVWSRNLLSVFVNKPWVGFFHINQGEFDERT